MYALMIYSLKAGVCLAVFYLFFKLLLSRETLHRFNRIVCLGAVALAFLLPVCVITVVRELPAPPEAAMEFAPTADVQEAPAPAPFPWERLAAALFAVGAVVTLGRMLWSIGCVLRLVGRGRRRRLDDGSVLVLLDEQTMPFSWGHYIVLSERDYAESGQEILIHERAHLRLRHSFDLFLTDLAGCLQWFNPAMWLLRRELRAIQEYEADEAVLRSGVDAKHYQLMLIKKAVGGRWYSVANSFNHSKLKNRITMMLQKKSSRWACAKALFLLPLTGIALASFAQTAYVVPDDKVKKESVTVQIVGGNAAVDGADGNPLVVVDGKKGSRADLESGRIARVKVLKGDAATAAYGEEGKDGVIEVSLKKGGDADSVAGEVVVVDGQGAHSQIERIDLGTTGKIVTIRSREEHAADKGPVFILDGKVASQEQIATLQAGDVAKMYIDKTGTAANGVVFITSKTSEAAVQQGLKAAREGYEAAREGIKAGEEGIEAARAVLESARRRMSKKEWQTALKQLDDAQRQLAEAREEMSAAGAGLPEGTIETRNGNRMSIRVDKNSGDSSYKVDLSGSGAGTASTVTLSSGSLSSGMMPSLTDGKTTVYIDGKKADKRDLDKLSGGKIRRMKVYKGEAAVAKYGEAARDGVIEVTTE